MHGAVCATAAANAATLRELRVDAPAGMVGTRCAHLDEVLRAAPNLQLLQADVYEHARGAAALRSQPPFGALRVRRLDIDGDGAGGGASAADMVALAAGVAAQASVTVVRMHVAPLDAPGALDALVDAALTPRQLLSLQLSTCGLSPASAPRWRACWAATRCRSCTSMAGSCWMRLLRHCWPPRCAQT
jgi:hypothetical protein